MTVEESLNLAVQRHQAGDLANAQDLYRQVLMKDPKHADAWHLLGVVHYQSGDSNSARDLIKKAIALKPVTMDYYYNLGLVYNALGSRVEAISTFHRAAMLPASNPGIMTRLAKALADLRQWADAQSCLRQVMLNRPDDADALVVQGKIFLDKGDFEKGTEVFGRVAKLRPDDNWVQWNYGLLLLMHGRFAEGWPKFEYRIRGAGGALIRPFVEAQWDGGEAAGKTLLVHAEGEDGETIQYARYLPMLKARVGKVILECPRPMVLLMESVEGIGEVVGRGSALPEYDLHLPLQYLPGIFKADLTNIPSEVPYLKVSAERLSQWSARVGGENLRKVGLIWAHSQAGGGGAGSNSLEKFAPLAEINGVRFYSLQTGPESVQSRPAGLELVDLTADIVDMADAAGLISQMDLVICVDTPQTHLAGALGKQVWLLAANLPAYQWLLNRSDSPWYPTMRIFRQPAVDDWATPVGQIVEALKELK